MVFTYNMMHKDGIQAQGGYSSHIIVDEHYAFRVAPNLDMAGVAPLLCAGAGPQCAASRHRPCSANACRAPAALARTICRARHTPVLPPPPG